MTIRELVQYQQNNRQTQSISAAPQRPNGSLPPEGHVNPYGAPGMDITGTFPDSYKIIPVDEGVANQLRERVFRNMVERGGVGDGEGIAPIVKPYIMSLQPEDRLNAMYTLEQIHFQEADRLAEYVNSKTPEWSVGKPVDPSILEGYQRGVDITV